MDVLLRRAFAIVALASVASNEAVAAARAEYGASIHALQPVETETPQADANELGRRIDQASAAWQRGDYPEVRELLTPIVNAATPEQGRALVEVALRYLADSVLLDQTVDADVRRRLARGYIERQYNENPEWSPPPGLHGDAFYELVGRIRAERESAKSANCAAERMACQADLREVTADKIALDRKHAELQAEHAKQIVWIEEKVARNRAAALVPGGIGHFYNGRPRLGATFLATELAVGAIGLGFLLNRVITLKCQRTNGFTPGSLQCDPPASVSDSEIENRRKAEQAFGIVLLSTLALDVLVAQITFRPFSTIGRRAVERQSISPPSTSLPNLGEDKQKGTSSRAKAPAPSVSAGAMVAPRFTGLKIRMTF
jgi:hypothetical protein